MHVHLRRAAALSFLAGAAVFTSASCARDDSSIFIRGVVDVSRTDCSFQVSDNPVLITQVQGGQYKVVWPADAAEAKPIIPTPAWTERK